MIRSGTRDVRSPSSEGTGRTPPSRRPVASRSPKARLEQLRTWFDQSGQWDEEWAAVATDSGGRLKLTRTELESLSRELHEVLMRYVDIDRREETPSGAAIVEVQLYAFPTRLLDDPPNAEQ